MKQKKFYEAFDLLYMAVKEALYISQKEEFNDYDKLVIKYIMTSKFL